MQQNREIKMEAQAGRMNVQFVNFRSSMRQTKTCQAIIVKQENQRLSGTQQTDAIGGKLSQARDDYETEDISTRAEQVSPLEMSIKRMIPTQVMHHVSSEGGMADQ
jgi:hypothetical protein